MNITREKIVIVEEDAARRENLRTMLDTSGYDVAAFATAAEALEAIHSGEVTLLLIDADARQASELSGSKARDIIATIRGSAATEMVRVILLVGSSAEPRIEALNLGADDAISQPFDSGELLARVRTQVRAFREQKELRDKTRIAIEGQQIAHTAFEAIAVTEKMTNDAVTLDRSVKVGLVGILATAVVMAGIYFLFVRTAQKETKQGNAIIARIEGGLLRQQSLVAEARKLRTQQGTATTATPSKQELQQQAADLKSKMANSRSHAVVTLQKQVEDTNARLARIEKEGQGAQSLIPDDVQSVCLLHVSVAFRDKNNGQRLRYAGLNQQGEPLQDSENNPVLTVEGRGPEVKLDVFGP